MFFLAKTVKKNTNKKIKSRSDLIFFVSGQDLGTDGQDVRTGFRYVRTGFRYVRTGFKYRLV